MPLCGVVVVPVEPEVDELEEELDELVAEVVPLVVAEVVPEEGDFEPPLPPLLGFGGWRQLRLERVAGLQMLQALVVIADPVDVGEHDRLRDLGAVDVGRGGDVGGRCRAARRRVRALVEQDRHGDDREQQDDDDRQQPPVAKVAEQVLDRVGHQRIRLTAQSSLRSGSGSRRAPWSRRSTASPRRAAQDRPAWRHR